MIMDCLAGSLVQRSGLLATGAGIAAAALALAVGFAQASPRATQFTLDNGMDVVVIPDHRAPVVTHMVWYRVGAADEPPGTSGIAHFLEHLMFKGTEKLPVGQFSRTVAREGGRDNAFTSHDVTAYFQRVATDRLPLVMELEADRMANLTLPEEEVEMERLVILEERRTRVDNDPSSILQEQMMAALYQAHPYGIPVLGWEHEMRALSRQDAHDFYRRFYGPNNAILVVAGDVTPEEVESMAEAAYGRLEPIELEPRVRPQEPPHYAAVRVYLEDARAGQATVQRYYLAPSHTTGEPGEAEALQLLMRIAGGGSASRLHRHLVVNDKVAASAGGWYSGTGLDGGRIGVYAVAASDTDIDAVEAAMDDVLSDIKENGVTQAELDRARSALIANYVYNSDSQSRLARRYGWAIANGQTIKEIEAWPERIEAVTVEDVQRVARNHLVDTQSVTGVLLPASETQQRADNAGGQKDS